MKHLKAQKELLLKQIDIIQKMYVKHFILSLKNLRLCYFKDSIAVQLQELVLDNQLMGLSHLDSVKAVKNNINRKFQINLKLNQKNKMMSIIWNRMKMMMSFNKIWILKRKEVINMKIMKKNFQLSLSHTCLQLANSFKIRNIF